MIPKSIIPQFDDAETTRAARLLFFVLATLLLALLMVIVIFLLDIQSLRDRLFVPALLFIGFALLYAPLRAGYVRFSALTTLGFLWAVITFWSYRTGGVFSPAYGAYVALILISGLLLGFRASLFFTLLVVSGGYLLTLMDRSNAEAISGLSNIFVWAIASILLFFAAILLGLATHSMKAAIRELRVANHQLQQEVEDHKHTQQSLRMSEEKYRNLFLAMPLSAYTKDRDGVYTSSNNIHRSYFASGDPVGKTDTDMQPQEIASRIRHNDLEVLRTQEKLTIEEHYRAPDGEIHIFQSHKVPLYDENGQLIGIMGTSRDITDIKKMEEQLDHYFQLSVDLMCIAGVDGYFKRVNPAFETTLGYTEAELLAKPIVEFIQRDDREAALQRLNSLQSVNADGKVLRFENRYLCKDESVKWLSWSAVPVGDLIYCVARDITEQKRLENQRIQLEVDRQMIDLRQNFLSIVSHELRTPLSVILTSSEILQRYDDRLEIERRLQHYDQLVYQARLMRTMIEEILLLNRFNSDTIALNLRPVTLDVLCQEIVDSNASIGTEVQIHYSNDSHLERIVTDEGLLRHILDNLLSNAVKYSSSGGSVCFKVAREGENAVFVIEDQGIGIPNEDQAQMFEPFHRASNVGDKIGTGLGLAIVKQSVDKLQGSISITSEPGVGTTVTVKVPISA